MQDTLFQKKRTTTSQETESQPQKEPSSSPLDDFDRAMDLAGAPKHHKLVRAKPPVATPQKKIVPERQLSTTDKRHHKTSRPDKSESVSDETVYLSAKIDRTLHRRLKIMSSTKGQSIKSVLETWIQENTPELS